MLVEYPMAKECKNKEERYSDICYKCGKCGRVFNNYGFMIDDGRTTSIYDPELPFTEEDYGEVH